MMWKMYLRPFLLLGMLSVGGCMISEVPELPESDVPEDFQGPVMESAEVWPELDWWNSFADDELSSLISTVQENNLDLANNLRNLESAQIALREAGYNLLPIPVVSIGVGARYTETDIDGISTSNNPNSPFDLRAAFTYNDILSKPATYNRALADYDARVAQAADLVLNTLGTASSTYFQILLIRDRIVAAEQNLENAETIGRIAQARVNAGVAVPIEALQQQIAIQRQRANIESLRQNDLAARASLALLTGINVQYFNVQGDTLEGTIVPTVQPGLPSELLQRRPDLAIAEANLRSASANVDLVRSDYFPNISLTGSINASSTSLSELVSSPDTALVVSADMVQTLLDNGQRSRNLEQARLSLENSLANYRKAVLSAFNEIEVLLSNIQLLQQLGEVERRNLEAAEESFRIAELRYEEGVANFETVLVAQNTLFTTRNSFLDNKLLQLNAIIGLYQALGGGWQLEETESSIF